MYLEELDEFQQIAMIVINIVNIIIGAGAVHMQNKRSAPTLYF